MPNPLENSVPAQLLKTFSPEDPTFCALEGTPWHASFLEWVTANGIDPHKVGAIEVWDNDGDLSARFAVYLTDDAGRKMLVPGTEYYAQAVGGVPLSSLPPEQPPVAAYKSQPDTITAARLTRLRADAVALWVADGGKNDVLLKVPGEHDSYVRLTLDIPTPEGTLTAVQGDWIVRDADGGFRPVKDEEFRRTYTPSA